VEATKAEANLNATSSLVVVTSWAATKVAVTANKVLQAGCPHQSRIS
jgi:hypothetical protein